MNPTNPDNPMAHITVYGASWCSDCKRAKKFLGEQRVHYNWVDIEEHPESQAFVEKANNGKRIIPTIVFEDGSVLVEPSNAQLAQKLNLRTVARMAYYDVLIVGGGPTGLTTALYAAREGLDVLVIERSALGGQAGITERLDNFPGFPDGIQGPELIENMKKQASRFGAEYRHGHVVSADLSQRPFSLNVGKETLKTKALIIASGASARWLGLPNEQMLIGHGVSSCATCDGFFFSGKEIAVIGGGDTAMEEATFLTRFASKVTLIHRREEFRASKIMLERAQKNPKIEFLMDTVVEDVLDASKKEVTGLKLKNVKTGKAWDFPTSAMFLGIGHEPNAKMFIGQLDADKDGYLITHPSVVTRVPGVFASGDVMDRRYRQAITAAGTGCMAAIEVEKFLEHEGH